MNQSHPHVNAHGGGIFLEPSIHLLESGLSFNTHTSRGTEGAEKHYFLAAPITFALDKNILKQRCNKCEIEV